MLHSGCSSRTLGKTSLFFLGGLFNEGGKRSLPGLFKYLLSSVGEILSLVGHIRALRGKQRYELWFEDESEYARYMRSAHNSSEGTKMLTLLSGKAATAVLSCLESIPLYK